MLPSDLDHPNEEELERFLLHQSEEKELEVIETHILACEACVARLETLETQVAVMKMALEQMEAEQKPKESPKAERSWRAWFTVPRLSWAAAVAVLLLGITLVPQFTHLTEAPAEVSLSAYRGVQTPTVPVNRPLHIRLNAVDLAGGPVQAEIVNSGGAEVWQARTAIHNDKVEIDVPGMRESGAHFLRLYSANEENAQRDLLREFAFQVK